MGSRGILGKSHKKGGQMGVKVEVEQVAKFLQWSNFIQFGAPISIRLMTHISEFGLDSSCLSRLDDVGVFNLYNYKNSHKMR